MRGPRRPGPCRGIDAPLALPPQRRPASSECCHACAMCTPRGACSPRPSLVRGCAATLGPAISPVLLRRSWRRRGRGALRTCGPLRAPQLLLGQLPALDATVLQHARAAAATPPGQTAGPGRSHERPPTNACRAPAASLGLRAAPAVAGSEAWRTRERSQ